MPCEKCGNIEFISLEMLLGTAHNNSGNMCSSQTPQAFQGGKKLLAEHRQLATPLEACLWPSWGFDPSLEKSWCKMYLPAAASFYLSLGLPTALSNHAGFLRWFTLEMGGSGRSGPTKGPNPSPAPPLGWAAVACNQMLSRRCGGVLWNLTLPTSWGSVWIGLEVSAK